MEVEDAVAAASLAAWARADGVGADEIVPARGHGPLRRDRPGRRRRRSWTAGRPTRVMQDGPLVRVAGVLRRAGPRGRRRTTGDARSTRSCRGTRASSSSRPSPGSHPASPTWPGCPPTGRCRAWPSPRARVAPGSVGLADAWCGVYPTASPGGWLLLGTTAAVLWDVDRDRAGAPGAGHARAVRGDVSTRGARPGSADDAAGPRSSGTRPPGGPARRCARPGRGGPRAADSSAADPDDAVLETTMGGVERADVHRRHLSRSPGRRCAVRVDARAVGHSGPVTVPADSVITVGPGHHGRALLPRVRRWHRRPTGPRLAVHRHPGLGRPAPAGCRATCSPSGPRAACPAARRRSSYDPGSRCCASSAGPRADWVDGDGLGSPRRGVVRRGRPTATGSGCGSPGRALERRGGELASEGIVLGGLQLPPSGQPRGLPRRPPDDGRLPGHRRRRGRRPRPVRPAAAGDVVRLGLV